MVKVSVSKRKCMPPTLESGPRSRNLSDEEEKELLEGLLHPQTKVTDEDKEMYMSLLRPPPLQVKPPLLQKNPKCRIVSQRITSGFGHWPVRDPQPLIEPTYLKNRKE